MEMNERIREARGEMSQQALAAAVGVSRGAVAQWERKANPIYPRRPKLELIAEATGVDLNWLLTGQGEIGGSKSPSDPDGALSKSVVSDSERAYDVDVAAQAHKELLMLQQNFNAGQLKTSDKNELYQRIYDNLMAQKKEREGN